MSDPADASRSVKLSLGVSTDTPFKPSVHNRVMYGENAEQAQDSVKRDLKNNVRIVSPQDFREHFLGFPVSESLSGAFKEVKKALYNNGHWRNFPNPKPKEHPLESKFYGPFVEVAETVNKACRQHAAGGAVESVWLDRHSKPPGALSEDDAKVRPDIVLVSKSTSKEFEKLSENLSVEDKAKIEKSISVWWMQIHTIVEIKPERQKNSDDVHTTIVQLCSYIRQIFREQFDRRFVMALLLCGEELTLWFCDRVGLVGTIEPINIHNDPEEFINILAAFSMLPAHRLGWDPTMMLYPDNGTKAVPSYTVFQDRHPYTFKWCISMPSKEDPNRREEFVMVRALITVFSQRICGRASLVWEAVRKEDFRRGEFGKVFVLKQAWQPVTKDVEEAVAFDSVFEVDMYEKAQLRKDRIYSYERVKTEENTIVSTQLFRGDLELEEFGQAAKKLKPEDNHSSAQLVDDKVGQKRIRSEDDEPFSYINLLDIKDNIFDVDHNKANLHPRALVRILMDKRGYPLKYFVDHLELVTALRDAIRDHERMYEKGILHRDISSGNILICDDDMGDTKDAGMLIDLDHAKYSANRRPVPSFQGAITDQRRESWYREEPKVNLEPDVVSRAVQIFEKPGEASTYLDSLIETLPECMKNDSDTNIMWTANKLYWPNEIKKDIPDFSSHKPRDGLELTGTIPFISVELLYFTPLNPTIDYPIHNAVHDMESILWVLLYICLTREANEGGIRRHELQPNSPDKDRPLLQLICDLFENDNAKLRTTCLRVPKHFEGILENVHSYFHCLKPLLLKLRWVLYLAHRHQGIEHYNIHSIVLAIFEASIAKLKQHRNDREIVEAKEKRRKQWMKWRAVPQVPDADEESERPSDMGGYSPVSETKKATLDSLGPKQKRTKRGDC